MKVVIFISKITNYIATVMLVVLMMVTVTDVVGRYLFKHPIIGSMEISEVMILSIAALGLAWCAVNREHIKVDLLMSHFPQRAQHIIDSITLFLGFCMTVILTWQTVREAMMQFKLGTDTSLIHIPKYPFFYLLAFGLAMLCIIMAYHVVTDVRKAVKR